MAFLPLGSGGITHCGWAVTACSPGGVCQPSAGTRALGPGCVPWPASPSPWPQGCHPRRAGEHNRPPCRGLLSPRPPPANAPSSVPQPDGGSWGSPPGAFAASHPLQPYPACAGSPRMQYQPSRCCGTQGAPVPPLALFWGILPARGAPNYLRPPGGSGLGAVRGQGRGLGTVTPLSAETSSPPFSVSPGRWWGCHRPPARSLVLAAGDRDSGGAAPLQVGLISFLSLYNNNY